MTVNVQMQWWALPFDDASNGQDGKIPFDYTNQMLITQSINSFLAHLNRFNQSAKTQSSQEHQAG